MLVTKMLLPYACQKHLKIEIMEGNEAFLHNLFPCKFCQIIEVLKVIHKKSSYPSHCRSNN
jgi:hypothetical protein